MTGKRVVWVFALLGLFAFSLGCTDDLTQRTITRDVDLDPLDLAGKAMTCDTMSVDALIAMADGYEDWVDKIKSVKIKSVWYQVTFNDNAQAATGSLEMTDPFIRVGMAEIGSGAIPAGPTLVDWTKLPFTDDGKAIVQYFINNGDEVFDYCAVGDSAGAINMTVQFSFELAITIKII